MSKLTQENRDKAKKNIFGVLTNTFASTYAVQRKAHRSWKFTKDTLEKLFEEGKVEKIELDNLVGWKKKNG